MRVRALLQVSESIGGGMKKEGMLEEDDRLTGERERGYGFRINMVADCEKQRVGGWAMDCS